MSICAVPGCPEDATHHGRCKPHREEVTGTGSRGSTRASRARRQCVLDDAKVDGVSRCFYCNAPADRGDHFIPLAEGGLDDEGNMVAACTPCNDHKGKQMPAVFMVSPWLARRCEEVASRGD